MPVTSWLDDRTPSLSPETWFLEVGSVRLDLADLGNLPQVEVEALIDCTGGWYSVQTWRGVRLDQLVEAGGWRSFEVRSATGYARRLPVADLDKTYLALRLGGEPLSPDHGYPLRLVAPGRRGFWWVKWVVSVRPSMLPWWLQSPFPLT
jgi:DMSO/TMAO reductase YedYZ molybdopterin-dependent catalytic subunit